MEFTKQMKMQVGMRELDCRVTIYADSEQIYVEGVMHNGKDVTRLFSEERLNKIAAEVTAYEIDKFAALARDQHAQDMAG